ncbi:hypothetical protein Tco_0780533 [Tanacetum coccineum]
MAELLFNKFKGDKVRILLVQELREMLQALGEIMLQVKQGLLSVTIVKGKGIWQGSALSLRGQGILHGSKKRCCWFRHRNMTDDLDAYDSDCDDISSAKAFLMANLSSYDTNVLSEMYEQMSNQVTHWDKVNQKTKTVNESLTAELERYKERVKFFKQRLNINLISREKMIDSQMDDIIWNRNALKQEIDSLKQTLSKQVKEKESLLQTFTVFKKESKEKENKYMNKEIDLENKIKELDNIIYKVGQSAQTDAHANETTKQAFWLLLSNPKSEQLDVTQTPVEIEVPKELLKCSVDKKYFDIQMKELSLDNDRLLDHIICQDVMDIVMYADFVPINVLSVNNKCLVNDNLEIKRLEQENDHLFELLLSQDIFHICVELAKKEHMVEKKFFDEVVLRSFNNQKAPKILEFFKINEWQAKHDAKDVSIANLKKHIESLKGKNVVEKDFPLNKAKVIALEMFKLDLEPLAPKVLRNRDAHIDYIRHSREHADTLREIVETLEHSDL